MMAFRRYHQRPSSLRQRALAVGRWIGRRPAGPRPRRGQHGAVEADDAARRLLLSGPSWTSSGRAGLLVQDAGTCPKIVAARAVSRCTPRAKPPKSIRPGSGILRSPVKFGVDGLLDDERNILVAAPLRGLSGDATMQ